MALIKSGSVRQDHWIRVGEGEPLPDFGSLLVTCQDWRGRRADLLRRNSPLGVLLASDEPPALIADDLPRLGLVALDFPEFTDGRAYSYARLLRERYGFGGEIRAVGDVQRDQYLFLQRCGFDAFEVADDADPEAWLEAIAEFSVTYQAAADARRPAGLMRHEAEEPRRTFARG